MEALDPLDTSTFYDISPNTDDKQIPENTVFIKQERYGGDYDSPLNQGYIDVNKVKKEVLNDYNTLVTDPLDTSVKVDPYIKDELDNTLLGTRNLELYTTTIQDPKTGASKISTIEDHPPNVNTTEKLSTNTCLSEPVELTNQHRDRLYCDTTNNPMLQGELYHKLGKYVCNVCYKSWSSTAHLARHARIHTGERPYECDICHKSFNQSSGLALHKLTHTGEKPHVCDVCHKAFTFSFRLVVHKRTHTGERPYVCDVCLKGFSSSGHLGRHKSVHTGEKKYVCDVCQKAFSCSSSLAKHKRTHW